MTTTPPASDEAARCAALGAYRILDSEREETFDAIARLAAAACDAPMALVSFVDGERVWIKSTHGLPGLGELPRGCAFCAYPVAVRGFAEVSDAAADPRYRENVLVAGDARVRFYAGMPLIDERGVALGVLAVLDRRPRSLSARERGALSDLSVVLMGLLSARRYVRVVECLQTRLAEVEQELHAVVDNVPAMIGFWGADLKNRFGNHAYIEWFGYTPERMRGRHIREIIGEKLFALNWPYMEQALLGQAQHFEREIVDAKGMTRYGQASYIPNLRDGVVDGFFVLVSDITQRVQAERALSAEQENARRAREEALEASRAKSRFLANMSHEIRTPMNGVLGMLTLIRDTPLSEEQRGFVEMAYSSAESLLAVIDDILDVSKIEAHKLELDAQSITLESLVRDACRSVAARAHEQGIELLVDIDAEVPHRIMVDALRLRQVLTNLIANAVKFTARGEVTTRVRVVPGPEGTKLVLSVQDSGIGIAPERQESIFAAFAQADSSTTRTYGGTGLGLTICKELVSLMGGRIWLSSTLGVGSTFSFELPLVAAAIEPGDAVPRAHGERLLLVDDHELNRTILAGTLTASGFVVSTARSAAEALLVLRAEPRAFHAVLIDQLMPNGDGIALARAMQAYPEFAGVPKILLRSLEKVPTELLAGAGVAHSIMKPVFPSDVLRALAPADASTQREERSAPPRPVGPLRVLVVEDQPVNAHLMRALLERSGHTARHVISGAEALRVLERERFDVIVMDMQMPEMDGLEATRRIRASEEPRGLHTPIIALTASAMQSDHDACIAAGMDGFLRKPIDVRALMQALASVTQAGRGAAPER